MTRKIYEIRGHKSPTVADMGVEVEIETLPDGRFPTVGGWTKTRDGSLRGTSVEYVSDPMSKKDIDVAISDLKKRLIVNNTKVLSSIRAGVHVHLNFTNNTLDEVLKFAALYAIFERSLMKFCGPDREGNYNCLPICDSEYVVEVLNSVKNTNDLWFVDTDNIRYCAINFRSLIVHGTVEMRAMQTKPGLKDLQEWVDILHTLKIKSLEYNSVENILEHYSMNTYDNFALEVFEPSVVSMLDPKEEDMVEGMRIAQDICYGGL